MVFQPINPAVQQAYRDSLLVTGSPPQIDTEIPPQPVVDILRGARMIEMGTLFWDFTDAGAGGGFKVTQAIRTVLGAKSNQVVVLRSMTANNTNGSPTKLTYWVGDMGLLVGTFKDGGQGVQVAKIDCGNGIYLASGQYLGDVIEMDYTVGSSDYWIHIIAYEIWEVPTVKHQVVIS